MHTVQEEKLWESKQLRRIPICFNHLQPSQDTIKMSKLEPAAW